MHGPRGLWPAACGLLAAGAAQAAELPEDRAEALVHVYDGGGVRAVGPALLVRKSLGERVSLSGTLYIDHVSNASVDVVTAASPYSERRTAVDVGADFVWRDALVKFAVGGSSEPDFRVRSLALDVSQQVFGAMTSVNLGFGRSSDRVGKAPTPGHFDRATHWQYRLGVTQVLTPRWLASVDFEAIADDGFLGSPYRVARVFGAAVPERVPRTRSARALRLAARGDVAGFGVVRGEYRRYQDTWGIRADTVEVGHGRELGAWTAEAALRLHRQAAALFYADDARAETLYVSRNRQLAAFDNVGVVAKASYTFARGDGGRRVRLVGAYEFKRYSWKDFTDPRSGILYGHDAHLLQIQVSADY